MDNSEIKKILDEIDVLMLNGLDDKFHFLNDEKTTAIAALIKKIENEFKNEDTKLYQRFRIVTNAFLVASNGSTIEDAQADDAIKYFTWLEKEKSLAARENIPKDEIQLLRIATCHEPEIVEKGKTEILGSDNPPSETPDKESSPKKSLLQKVGDGLRKLWRKFFKVEEPLELLEQPSTSEGQPSQFVPVVKTPKPIQQETLKQEIVVISDIHGDINKWNHVKNALKKNPKMKIIILGDAMDRGEYGLQILMQIKELCDEGRAEYLPGNHDEFAYQCLVEGKNDPAKELVRSMWEKNGGDVTIKSFDNFDTIMEQELRSGKIKKRIGKMELIEWLGERPIQKVLTEGGYNYALSHAVFDNELYNKDPEFNLKKALSLDLKKKESIELYQRYRNCLWYREEDEKTHYANLAFPDGSVMVAGHTRQTQANVSYLDGKSEQPIIYVDCGKGKLQGYNLTTGKHVQLEPQDPVR